MSDILVLLGSLLIRYHFWKQSQARLLTSAHPLPFSECEIGSAWDDPIPLHFNRSGGLHRGISRLVLRVVGIAGGPSRSLVRQRSGI